jgi:hypothetical protein
MENRWKLRRVDEMNMPQSVLRGETIGLRKILLFTQIPDQK